MLPALKEIKDLKVVAECRAQQARQVQQVQQDQMVSVHFYTTQLLLTQYLAQHLVLVHGVVGDLMQ